MSYAGSKKKNGVDKAGMDGWMDGMNERMNGSPEGGDWIACMT